MRLSQAQEKVMQSRHLVIVTYEAAAHTTWHAVYGKLLRKYK
jgi:hypothetical protein